MLIFVKRNYAYIRSISRHFCSEERWLYNQARPGAVSSVLNSIYLYKPFRLRTPQVSVPVCKGMGRSSNCSPTNRANGRKIVSHEALALKKLCTDQKHHFFIIASR